MGKYRIDITRTSVETIEIKGNAVAELKKMIDRWTPEDEYIEFAELNGEVIDDQTIELDAKVYIAGEEWQ